MGLLYELFEMTSETYPIKLSTSIEDIKHVFDVYKTKPTKNVFEIKYEFKSPQYNYFVYLRDHGFYDKIPVLELAFGIYNEDREPFYDISTNENIYKTLSTVFSCIMNFDKLAQKYYTNTYGENFLYILYFEGVKDDDEDFDERVDSKRTRLYKAVVEKNIKRLGIFDFEVFYNEFRLIRKY